MGDRERIEAEHEVGEPEQAHSPGSATDTREMPSSDEQAEREIDAIISRLDEAIPRLSREVDELLDSLRSRVPA